MEPNTTFLVMRAADRWGCRDGASVVKSVGSAVFVSPLAFLLRGPNLSRLTGVYVFISLVCPLSHLRVVLNVTALATFHVAAGLSLACAMACAMAWACLGAEAPLTPIDAPGEDFGGASDGSASIGNASAPKLPTVIEKKISSDEKESTRGSGGDGPPVDAWTAARTAVGPIPPTESSNSRVTFEQNGARGLTDQRGPDGGSVITLSSWSFPTTRIGLATYPKQDGEAANAAGVPVDQHEGYSSPRSRARLDAGGFGDASSGGQATAPATPAARRVNEATLHAGALRADVNSWNDASSFSTKTGPTQASQRLAGGGDAAEEKIPENSEGNSTSFPVVAHGGGDHGISATGLPTGDRDGSSPTQRVLERRRQLQEDAERVTMNADEPSPFPWREMRSSPAVWAVVAGNVGAGVGINVVMSWLPTYFSDLIQMDLAEVGFWTKVRLRVGGAWW